MVNNNIIQNPIKQSILDKYIIQTTENIEYIIEKNTKDNFWYMKNKFEPRYNILSIDTPDMILTYAKKLIGLEFNSILISGLGIGIIPYMCQDYTEIIDVVEVDQKVIDLTTSIGHLNSKVNIINLNINEYSPQKKYDVILFDHWMIFAPQDQMDFLKQKFSPFLNEGGVLTIPIYEQMHT